MKNCIYFLLFVLVFTSCKGKVESIKPSVQSITESVYASGFVESEDQYQVFPAVNGIIDKVYVTEGDLVSSNTLLFSIYNETSHLNKENAELAAQYSDLNSNLSKLNDLKLTIDLARNRMKNDSLMYVRQKTLFDKDVISSSQLEQSELTYQNSQTNYQSALYKFSDLKKQLNLNDKQSKNNVSISEKIENDYTVKSDLKGKVYSILKKKGEMVNIQTPIAIIGDAKTFKIELQVDEYDIIKVKNGQKIIIALDSYKGQTFEAVVSKIDPIMNDRSKTFTVEALFTRQPPVLYPNLSLEANIVIRKKENALIIPRRFCLNDQYVFLKNGDKIKVTTGLKDYQNIEITAGISKKDILILPAK